MQFQLNKNNATRGIYFQKEKPKPDQRKFGYKSKTLRHPIRQPDYEEEIEKMQKAVEEDKRKFNKKNTDFIRRNRERYKPKENAGVPAPGSTHIAPGTVTLTQDQLATLLKTLGKTSNGDHGSDNPLRISIDAENNKIEVERYESDSNGGRDSISSNHRRRNNSGDNDDNVSEVGIEALLNSDSAGIKGNTKKTKRLESRPQSRSGTAPKPQASTNGPEHSSNKPVAGPSRTSVTRLSWDDAKKEAGVSHVPDTVPWRHLTVAERKRLQWARERAEVEEYDPWGRPGAGAPTQKQTEEIKNQTKGHSRTEAVSKADAVKSSNERKKEELANEILQLQMEIREAEKRRKEEEENVKEQHLEDKKVKNPDPRPSKKAEREKTQQKEKQSSKKEARPPEENISEDNKNQDNEEAHLSRKEIERRKWLAELDKQREEQRIKKQMEKERDRAGLQDQWADRFVYHKSPRQISPSRAQAPQSGPSNGPVTRPAGQPVQAFTVESLENAPPAAMRSSLVVGDGTLNENRYDNKKAEEKRKWLQELEKQREEQRLARQALKERERQENNGTWADHYQTDRQKLMHAVPHHLGQGQPQQVAGVVSNLHQPSQNRVASPPATSNVAGRIETEGAEATATQRSNSAPYPPLAATAPDEPPTFLRGQAAFVDPVTRKEQEEKRRVHLEYQAEIKAQIEEKERQKREERERKMREDMEEERKLQMEREKFNKQMEQEQRKLREKEEQRQKQIDALKSAMDEAQEKALEEKTYKRIHHLQAHGHDVTQLKATYDEPVARSRQSFVPVGAEAFSNKNHENEETTEASPRTKHYDMSAIPGLGTNQSQDFGPQQNRGVSPGIQDFVDGPRSEPVRHEQARPHYPLGQSYTKEPYVEDRVLTPSRFRQPTQTLGGSISPRREFGTQTLELSELQNILNSLPEDIQIEYKLKVEDALRQKEEKARNQPTRKVHVKGADEVDCTRGGKPPVSNAPSKRTVKDKPEQTGPKQRLAWNQKQRKTVVKNSERDPFYQQKKEQSEVRRARRERQLQYLQELNSENIPTEHASRSKSRHEHCSPRREGESEAGENRGRKVANARTRGDASHDHSPNVLSLLNNNDGELQNQGGGGRVRRGAVSPAPQYPLSTGRSSPAIPTVRHRAMANPNSDKDPYFHANQQFRESHSNTKYGDASFLPSADGEFVPFMRTTEILDPARAEEPMAMSRENSRMERARKAYRETHNPAGIGKKVEIYQDREREAALKASQNPLINPGLVTDHPTARQDMILQQLSSLKQTLMQRQKELETYMSPAELEAETVKG